MHHVHPCVSEAVDEIHRILKPGGYFCFAEPHKGSYPDVLRQFWYRHDRLFEENEQAIDLDGLKGAFSSKFDFTAPEKYKGNVAYLFILNSMILRVNASIKAVVSPLLLGLEAVVERIQGKRLSCYVVCQWQKKKG